MRLNPTKGRAGILAPRPERRPPHARRGRGQHPQSHGESTAGVDPVELIDVMPLCQQIGQIIINDRSFYDLPRKFNIAYDGGGLIGTVEDTNDIGVKSGEDRR